MTASLGRGSLKALGSSLAAAALAISVGSSASFAADPAKPKPILLAPSNPKTADQQPPSADDPRWAPPGVRQYRGGPGRLPQGVAPSILGTSIQIDQLQAADPDSVGVLSVEAGGLGSEMWKGTERPLIDRLLPMLPVKSPSPALRGLMLRLLMSPGVVPPATADSPNFTILRMRLLMQLAEYAEAGQLLNVLPRDIRLGALLQTDVDRMVLSGETASACAVVAREVQTDVAAYWQKALVFCQVLAGEVDKAALGLSLLREMGGSDAKFLRLAEAAIGKTPVTVEDPEGLTALQLATALVGKAEFPSSASKSMESRLLKALLKAPTFAPERRFEAIERAAEIGLLRGDGLKQVYEEAIAGLKKTEADGADIAAAVQRAWLYQAAARGPVPTAKAEAVAQAFRSARADGRFFGVARLFHPLLATITRSRDLLWFAPDAMLAAAAAADADAAGEWFQLIRTSALMQTESRPILAAVTPLARIMKLAEADNAIKISQAVPAAPVIGKPQNATVNLRVSALLAGLGDPVADTQWWPAAGAEARDRISFPDPGLWLRMVRINGALVENSSSEPAGTQPDTRPVAADAGVVRVQLASPSAGPAGRLKYAGRVGERVLLALLAIGESGLGEISPVILYEALRGLRLAGLEDVARALAVEAMLTSRAP